MVKESSLSEPTGVLPIRLYQIHFTFNEPVQAVITIPAENEEEAIKKTVAEIEPHGSDVEIMGVQDLGEYKQREPEETKEEEPQLVLPDNVLSFPPSTTKH